MKVRAAMPEEFGWLVQRTSAGLTAGARGILTEDAAGRIRGMVVFDGWTENAAQAHIALDTPMAWRSLSGPVFEYVFEQCGKGVFLVCIPSHNARSIALTRRLGFREAHRVRDGWAPGDDLILFEMRREDWRARKAA